MRKQDGPQLCFCKYYGCNGKPLNPRDWEIHNVLSIDVQLRELEGEVAKVVLVDPQPPTKEHRTRPHAPVSTTIPNALPSPRLKAPELGTRSSKPASNGPLSAAVHDSRKKDVYRELYRIDATMHQHIQDVDKVLTEWSHSGSLATSFPSCARFQTRREAQHFLTQEMGWLRECVARVKSVQTQDNQASTLLRATMIERAKDKLLAISGRVEAWQRDEEIAMRPTNFYSTGKNWPPSAFIVIDENRLERFFLHPLRTHSPIIVIALFMVVALNLFANVPRSPCNFVLRLMKVILGQALQNPNDKALLDNLPDDIRTARRCFNLDPATTIYASCPSCFFAHPPTKKGGSSIDIYPARCSAKRYRDNQSCGVRLTKFAIKNGESIRVPIKPYPMQDFRAFVGGLLSRPGMEEAMTRGQEIMEHGDDIWDIMEADNIRNLRGPDGRLFLDCNDEIRTVWSLSYDGFNPLTNKAAGKSSSVGSLAMMCLSLPPSLRYRWENIFLAGLIPGRKQPTLDGLNPSLSPLVRVLEDCYQNGTWYSRTFERPNGRHSREAVVPFVADLVASRKVLGCAPHSATRFCSLCHLKKKDINNIDMQSPAWKRVTYEEHLAAAKAWLNAPNKLERKRLYKQNGIRWSELLNLSYWDPTKFAVIDGMHNLFLGLVRHHFREVIGTQWKEPKGEEEVQDRCISEREVAKGRQLLAQSPTRARLQRLTVPVLRSLCMEHNVLDRVVRNEGSKQISKKQYIEALQSTYNHLADNHQDSVDIGLEGGLGLIDMAEAETDTGTAVSSSGPMLLTADLHQIHAHITHTVRPTWRSSPPKDFGMPSHGKLKADQWKTSIEFDLTVSLVQLWLSGRQPVSESDRVRQLKTIESTMYLAIAIRWGTSYRTSPWHAERFQHFIFCYVQSLRELVPDVDLHPIHHNALHLPDFLLQFGPMHGWWMFPFERLIGVMQKINTNFHFGELEQTMMNTFCATTELKASLQRPGCPEALQTCLPVVESCFPDMKEGTLMHDIQALGTPAHNLPNKHVVKLPNDIHQAYKQLTGSQESNFYEYARYTIRGNPYATRTTTIRNSTIFYQPTNNSTALIPGVIRQIFSPYSKPDQTFLAIHRHRPISWPIGRNDPFAAFPEFGANLWSKETERGVEIISSSERFYATEFRPWDDDKYVMKPIIEVRAKIIAR